MDVGNFDEKRCFRDEENELLQDEEVALNGLETGLDTGVPIAATMEVRFGARGNDGIRTFGNFQRQ